MFRITTRTAGSLHHREVETLQEAQMFAGGILAISDNPGIYSIEIAGIIGNLPLPPCQTFKLAIDISGHKVAHIGKLTEFNHELTSNN